MDPGFYRAFRYLTPSGFRKWIDRYNFDSAELQDMIQTNPAPIQVQTLDCTVAQTTPLLINFPARAFVIYFYDSTSSVKTRKTNGFVKVRINQDRAENEFPAKHNRGYRGDYFRLYLTWEAQTNTKADLVMHLFDDDPWEMDSISSGGSSAGTVTSVSVVSANGFAGTVANAGTTPAITLSTSINAPILAGDGTQILAATTTGSGSTAVLATAPTLSNPVVGTQATTDNTTKAASTAYVTTAIANAIAGVNPAVAVTLATTAAGDTSALTYNNGVAGIGATLTGAVNTPLAFDSVTLTSLNQSVLVKNDTQAPAGAFNGIYNLTQLQTAILPPVLTRRLDFDTPSDINNTGAIPVILGAANTKTTWVVSSNVATVGTDAITFTQFSLNPSTVLTNTLTSAHLLVGSAGNVATDVAVTGDVTISNAGVTAIGNTKVTNAMIANSTIDLTTKVTGVLPSANGGSKLVQTVTSATTAYASGTTQIPMDDTIPQNTEGDQYLSLAITPTSSTNKLRIQVVLNCACTGSGQFTMALFQDSTANALAANSFGNTADTLTMMEMDYIMTSGTTSATTFKIRAGNNGAGTFSINGRSGGRQLGGVMNTIITIQEYIP